jgi:uncharacterized protein YyaL (SSP411 family)
LDRRRRVEVNALFQRKRERLRAIVMAGALLAAGCKRASVPPDRSRAPEPDPALPGLGAPSAALTAKLRAALAARGPGYRPRTRHLGPGGEPRYTNRLILESSPYLLQHAHNPVSWYPWGEEAFARARREGKPIFLSIGYSTCHWCHVMEGESFEDEEIAATLNQRYVAIKVDREERPDVDAVYMSAVQALTGGGGWPMSVWLTPERTPFFGGTYFPPRDGVRGAARGFLTLLGELADLYRADPSRLQEQAQGLVAAVRGELEGRAPAPLASTGQSAPLEASVIPAVVHHLKRSFDSANGGLARAPKFPSSLPLRLLLRYHRRSGDAEALQMAALTLEKMAAGGMYDQIGGGFHRYATDVAWLVPHFEKMLYDNALLATAYLEAHQVTGRKDFARVVRETLDYVLGEMTAPSGAFHSATDADSEGEEGRFFVWTEPEIRAVLGGGRNATRFIDYYGVTSAGNFEGRNILHVPRPSEAERAALGAARAAMLAARARRIAPLRDEKVVAAWNGLMISAFASAGRVLDESRYAAAAARAADVLLTRMRPGGRLARSAKDGRTGPPGFLEDQAFVAAGLLDLYEASFDPRWLREALALAAETERLFADPERGGWFATAADHEQLLARERPSHDGATPSGTSVALLNALRIAAFTDDETWRAIADRALGALRPTLEERPLALTEALLALDLRTDAIRQVAIVWPEQAGPPAAAPLLAVVRRTFLPSRALAGGAEGKEIGALGATVSFVAEKRALGGRATAYVCERGRCELPTGDPEVLARQLARARSY